MYAISEYIPKEVIFFCFREGLFVKVLIFSYKYPSKFQTIIGRLQKHNTENWWHLEHSSGYLYVWKSRNHKMEQLLSSQWFTALNFKFLNKKNVYW